MDLVLAESGFSTNSSVVITAIFYAALPGKLNLPSGVYAVGICTADTALFGVVNIICRP
jgi:hypothetical protein